jgi:hypothetical protein
MHGTYLREGLLQLLPGAPEYSARFTGQLEYAKRGKGFG